MFVCLASFVAACGGPQPTRQPSTPTQPTAPTQPAAPNTAPTGTVIFPNGSTCSGGLPCTLDVQVNAYDKDGDPLTYRWRGCATGTSPRAACVVSVQAAVQALVDVSDGRGHTVTLNAPAFPSRAPYVTQLNFIGLSDASVSLTAFGNILDPDEGLLCGGGYGGSCSYLDSLTVSGDCRPTFSFNCSCLGGVELDIYRTASSGTCNVAISAKNRRGVVGTSVFTVPYNQGTGSPAIPPIGQTGMR